MKRSLFIVPLLLIGSLLAMPDAGVHPEVEYHTLAEIVQLQASHRIIEDWTTRYVNATTLEGEASFAISALAEEIDTTDLPYQNETTTRAKAAVVDTLNSVAEHPNPDNLVDGFHSLERLDDTYEVRR